MNPAGELTAAADKLDALLAEVTPGPWIFHGNPDPESLHCYVCGPDDDDTGGNPVLLEGGEEAWVDARYLAAMDPVVGRALSAVLATAAGRCRFDEIHHGDDFAARQSAAELDLARAILGGES